MRAGEMMAREVRLAHPEQSIAEAARMMAEIDAGILPVADGDRLVGMITDRDIAIRAVARGKNSTTPIGEVMSREVKYCFEDDDIEDVAQNMCDIQVRRLPVLNHDKRLVGILSLADIAQQGDGGAVSLAMSGIVEPGGQHNQKTDGRT
ncbi:MAG TPA: CBS domain-containing protein [Xanthobacteraceae bacterium]|nr:CBS domain-containing protein [Xanthobacteraceae bacterium]